MFAQGPLKKWIVFSSFNDTNLLHSVVCLKPGVWPHGGHTKMVTTIVSRFTKSHFVGNLISWPYSSKFAITATTHHSAMMYQIGGHEEATDSVWMLPRQQLGSWPPWLVGECSIAYLPSKNMITTTQQCQRVVM
jgi:hypothetical protein